MGPSGKVSWSKSQLYGIQKSVEPPLVTIASVEEKTEVVVERKKEEAVVSAPVAFGSRAPADDVRARLLGALMKKKEQVGYFYFFVIVRIAVIVQAYHQRRWTEAETRNIKDCSISPCQF